MRDLFERFVDRYCSPPPMPLEALPPGITGRALRPAWELEWMNMGLHMLATGIALGAVGVLVIFGAILCRANLKAILRSLLTNGIG